MKNKNFKRVISSAIIMIMAVALITAGFTTRAKAANDVLETYLNNVKATKQFVVYADEFYMSAHIDGNIAVAELKSVSEGIKAQSSYYSYVANGNGLSFAYLENANTYLFGNNVNPGNLNGGSRFKTVNTNVATTIANEMHINAATVAKEIDVKNSLKAIVSASNSIRREVSSNVTGATALAKADRNAAYNFIFATQSDINNQSFINAVNNYVATVLNGSAKMLVVMVVTNNNDKISFNNPMNGNAGFSAASGNIIWDFGSFAGTVELNQTIDGVFVAPMGTVTNNTPVDGRIVAKTVRQGGGQEIHYPIGSMTWEQETTTAVETTTVKETTTAQKTTETETTTAQRTTEAETTTAQKTTEAETTTAQRTTEAETTTAQRTTEAETTTAQRTTEAETTTAQRTTEAETTTAQRTTEAETTTAQRTTEAETTTAIETTEATTEASTEIETTKSGEVEADEETTVAEEKETTSSRRGEVEADEEPETGDKELYRVYGMMMIISGFGFASLGVVTLVKKH